MKIARTTIKCCHGDFQLSNLVFNTSGLFLWNSNSSFRYDKFGFLLNFEHSMRFHACVYFGVQQFANSVLLGHTGGRSACQSIECHLCRKGRRPCCPHLFTADNQSQRKAECRTPARLERILSILQPWLSNQKGVLLCCEVVSVLNTIQIVLNYLNLNILSCDRF